MRKYPKIISTLGEIGGNREILFFVFLMLYRYFRDRQFVNHKLNEVTKQTKTEEMEKYLIGDPIFTSLISEGTSRSEQTKLVPNAESGMITEAPAQIIDSSVTKDPKGSEN